MGHEIGRGKLYVQQFSKLIIYLLHQLQGSSGEMVSGLVVARGSSGSMAVVTSGSSGAMVSGLVVTRGLMTRGSVTTGVLVVGASVLFFVCSFHLYQIIRIKIISTKDNSLRMLNYKY